MLVLAAALISLHPPSQVPTGLDSSKWPLSPLANKLLTEGEARGWKRYVVSDTPASLPSRSKIFVNLQLAHGSHLVHISVNELKPQVSTADALESFRRPIQSGKRTIIDEPALTKSGLEIDVNEFTTKRIANMKSYAVQEGHLRILGVAKRAAIIFAKPDLPDGSRPATQRFDNQIYDDIIALALVAVDGVGKK